MKRHIELILVLILVGIQLNIWGAVRASALDITRILDRLLTNYSKTIHPTYNLNIPTVIYTNMNIKSIGPISSLDMSYSMDCYFRQEWKDPRLSFKAAYSQITLSIKMLDLIWKPDTYFLNGKESYLHRVPTQNRLVRLSRDGSILFSSRLTIKARCPMNLQDFPLDKQICPLWVGSFSYSADEISYRWKSKKESPDWKPIQIDERVKLSQFDLLGTSWNSTSFMKNKFEFIGMQFELKRHTGFYVLQVYIPCIMLVILSWVSFFLNREATSDRSCIGIMCVLSLATLSFDIRNEIPNVPYVTALDQFLIMCYLFLFASMIQFTLVHYFTKVGFGDLYSTNEADTEQEMSNKHSPTTPTTPISNFAQIEQQFKRIRNFKSYLIDLAKCVISDSHYKSKMTSRAMAGGVNSVSKCDKVARILFPVVFVIINMAYWIRYSLVGS